MISMHVQYNIATYITYVCLSTFIVECYYTMTGLDAIIVILAHPTMPCIHLVVYISRLFVKTVYMPVIHNLCYSLLLYAGGSKRVPDIGEGLSY